MFRFARETFKGDSGLSREASDLVIQAAQGNLNPGLGTKAIKGATGLF